MRFASLRLRNVPPAAISTPKLKLAILLVAAVLGLTNAATLTPPATHVAGSSQTWEYAVSFDNHIVLYDSQWQEVSRVAQQFSAISSLIYDEVQDRIFLSDLSTSDDVRVFALARDPVTREYSSVESVAAKIHEDDKIRGITFDPLERVLYWSDERLRRIYMLDLKQKQAEPQIYLQFDHEEPQAVTVDICRRFLYWTTHSDQGTTIERASLNHKDNNSSEPQKRAILVNQERLEKPIALEVDQFSDRMFWIDTHLGTEVSVESADLHGGDRQLLYDGSGRELPSLIVESDRAIVLDSVNDCAYEMNKTANATPKRLFCFKDSPKAIVKRPRFIEKHRQHPICAMVVEKLEEQGKQIAVIEGGHETSLGHPESHSQVICIHGEVNAKGHCVCSNGWTGSYCETKLCQNFCFHGTCAVGGNGFPVCHCHPGFTGERCEVERCGGYCLNDGRCALEGDQPVCHCSAAFTGRHCEMINSRAVICRAYCEVELVLPNVDWSIEDECVCSNSTAEPLCSLRGSGQIGGANFIYIIIAGVLVTIVLIVVMVLGAIRHWYKPARPKIKKTYVVRKNVTPLTYRPAPQEQCEITIENCCNMQYCDTPCFDPKILVKDSKDSSTSSSSGSSVGGGGGGAPKKEDKRDLLSNIVLDNNSDLF